MINSFGNLRFQCEDKMYEITQVAVPDTAEAVRTGNYEVKFRIRGKGGYKFTQDIIIDDFLKEIVEYILEHEKEIDEMITAHVDALTTSYNDNIRQMWDDFADSIKQSVGILLWYLLYPSMKKAIVNAYFITDDVDGAVEEIKNLPDGYFAFKGSAQDILDNADDYIDFAKQRENKEKSNPEYRIW